MRGEIEERSFGCVCAPAQTAGKATTRANFAQDDSQRKGKAPIEKLAGEYCASMGRGCTLSVGWKWIWGSGNKLASSGIGANSCRLTRPRPRKNNQRR